MGECNELSGETLRLSGNFRFDSFVLLVFELSMNNLVQQKQRESKKIKYFDQSWRFFRPSFIADPYHYYQSDSVKAQIARIEARTIDDRILDLHEERLSSLIDEYNQSQRASNHAFQSSLQSAVLEGVNFAIEEDDEEDCDDSATQSQQQTVHQPESLCSDDSSSARPQSEITRLIEAIEQGGDIEDPEDLLFDISNIKDTQHREFHAAHRQRRNVLAGINAVNHLQQIKLGIDKLRQYPSLTMTVDETLQQKSKHHLHNPHLQHKHSLSSNKKYNLILLRSRKSATKQDDDTVLQERFEAVKRQIRSIEISKMFKTHLLLQNQRLPKCLSEVSVPLELLDRESTKSAANNSLVEPSVVTMGSSVDTDSIDSGSVEQVEHQKSAAGARSRYTMIQHLRRTTTKATSRAQPHEPATSRPSASIRPHIRRHAHLAAKDRSFSITISDTTANNLLPSSYHRAYQPHEVPQEPKGNRRTIRNAIRGTLHGFKPDALALRIGEIEPTASFSGASPRTTASSSDSARSKRVNFLQTVEATSSFIQHSPKGSRARKSMRASNNFSVLP